ncbi:MAG: hypothetical protein LBK56_14435 [Gracilibacteraceae bacterium]|jgi:hypothetical protein|nr:hypothetical protein [Gracilibacteraceae bacterium]
MLRAPFRVPLNARGLQPLIFFDGDFNAAQDLFGDVTSRHAEGVYHIGRVEARDTAEIFFAEMLRRVQPAPGHDHKGGAIRERVLKLRPQRGVISFFYDRPGEIIGGGRFKDAVFRAQKYLVGVIIIILGGDLPRNTAQRRGECAEGIHVIRFREFSQYGRFMLRPHLP